MIWIAYGLAIWISVSLIFTAILAWGGWRFNQARERDEARRHHSIEPIQPIIRTWQ